MRAPKSRYRVHFLKTWPEYFEAIAGDRKHAEVRRDDRGFRRRDVLVLREWDPARKRYTGRELTREVSGVFPLDGIGVVGFVLLELRGIDPA